MNKRGQAALEYLMTYGWALVIIVVVAGILFFIISSPTAGVTCQSSDPAKIPLKASNVLSTDTSSEIKLTNGTAGSITVTGAAADGTVLIITAGTVNGDTMAASGMTTSVTSGQDIVIVPDGGANYFSTTASQTGNYTLSYTDQFGYAKTVTVTCQGTPTA